MKRKQWISLLCAAALLSGCVQKTNQPTFTGEETERPSYQSNLDAISPQAYSSVDGLNLEPGTYISIIGKSSDTAYWDTIEAGVKQAEADLNRKLGYSGSDKIKVVYSAPESTEDIDEQVNILDEEMDRAPNAIGIACIDADAYKTQFDLAVENGIPIISFDSGNSYQGILCECKTNNEEAASTGASKLCDEIGNNGSVLLLVHDTESASAKERVNGFRDEIDSHPDVQIAEILYYDQMQEMKKSIAAEQNASAEADTAAEQNDAAGQPGPDTMNEGEKKLITEDDISDEEVLQYYLEKHPEIRGIFGTNSTVTQWALTVLQEMEEEEYVLMGFDAGSSQLKALESGEIDGLVVQNPFGMGYAAVVAAARTILEIGNEAEVDTGYIWVTKDNMENESIKNMLYE